MSDRQEDPGAAPRSRPEAGPEFYRAHGLGNDYLVFRGGDALAADGRSRWRTLPAAVARVCHRTEGVGSDGILVVCSDAPPFRLRGFNPDGSEFERSGNGLRIVASFLHRHEWVAGAPFQAVIGGDTITMQVHAHDPATGLYDISVEMGRAVVGPAGVALDPAVLDRDGRMRLPHPARRPGGEAHAAADGLPPLDMVPVSVGNPHAVVWNEGIEIDDFGLAVATHPGFANGTNVQLARVTERREAGGEIWIDIWERGVGPTSASGSSSCASAVAAVHSGRLEPGEILVRMAGGELRVTVSRELDVRLRGPVQAVVAGRMDPGFVRRLAGD